MKTRCPHCTTIQTAPDEAAGREALCRSCRKVFTITEYTPPVIVPLGDLPDLDDIAITVDAPPAIVPSPKTPKGNFFTRAWAGHINLLSGNPPASHPTHKPPTETVTTICTLCGLAFDVPARLVRFQITCPNCNHYFIAYVPGDSGTPSWLTCSDCHAHISPRTFGHLTDDRKVVCYRCLCKANADLINNHMLPAMPPEKLLTTLYCARCRKYITLPPSALDRIVTCPHCFRPVHTPRVCNDRDWQLSIRVGVWVIAWILIVIAIGSLLAALPS